MTNDTDIQHQRPIDPGEKCSYAWGPEGFETNFCDDSFACGVCILDDGRGSASSSGLKIKGLCSENVEVTEEYDVDFYVHGMKNGKPHFK